jgi:excisionase family DNA binding protein
VNTMEKLLSVGQAAEFLGISVHTLRGFVSKRRIPFTKIGRRCLFDPAMLINFVKQNTTFPRPRREVGE